MDALISIGAGVSFLYSLYLLISGSTGPFYFESAGMIFTLITLGKALESNSKESTMDAINALSKLMPDKALVERAGKEISVGIKEVKVGDIVVVKAGESICVDGTVIYGTASIDKSHLTGESLPEEIGIDGEAVSGSMVLSGYIKIKALKVLEETTLSKIIEMVKDTASKKTPIERIADKVSGYFVPIVLGISFVTLAVWLFWGRSFDFSLNMAISVVVISCPCALGLATPTAIMTGTGNAARNGILIKNPECLEIAKNITTVVFDKTGTITKGKYTVSLVEAEKKEDEEKMVLLAAALEATSNHPYAKAICDKAVEYFEASTVMDQKLTDLTMIPGRGLLGKVNGETVIVGNEKHILEKGISFKNDAIIKKATSMYKEGKTVLYVATNYLLGFFVLEDALREDSKETIEKLKAQGKKVVLLSGDNKSTSEAIGKQVGIDKVISEVLPDEKIEVICKLQNEGEKVAMIGDGINDAAALIKADVGISVGNGTQIAIDSADFILMKESIVDVGYVFSLSKRVMKTIKQNLFWAFFYNVVGIPLAAGALVIPFGITLTPIIAAACMSVSSLFVVTNALRLRK